MALRGPFKEYSLRGNSTLSDASSERWENISLSDGKRRYERLQLSRIREEVNREQKIYDLAVNTQYGSKTSEQYTEDWPTTEEQQGDRA